MGQEIKETVQKGSKALKKGFTAQVTRAMMRGLKRLRLWLANIRDILWDAIALIPPKMPAQVFYAFAAPIMVYIDSIGLQGGLKYITETTHLNVWHIVITFALCGIVVGRDIKPGWYALATMPMFAYSVALAFGTTQGAINALGWLAVLYLFVAALAILVNMRQSYDNAQLLDKLHAIEEKAKQVERTLGAS